MIFPKISGFRVFFCFRKENYSNSLPSVRCTLVPADAESSTHKHPESIPSSSGAAGCESRTSKKSEDRSDLFISCAGNGAEKKIAPENGVLLVLYAITNKCSNSVFPTSSVIRYTSSDGVIINYISQNSAGCIISPH